MGAATTLLEPPAQQCNVVKWVLVNGLLVSFVLVSSDWQCWQVDNKPGQVEKNPDQGSQFASLELGYHMRTPAITALTQSTLANLHKLKHQHKHNAHKQTYTNTNTNTNTMLTRKLTQTQTQSH